MKIVLDPGHGGSDPGAVYQNINEADLNRMLCDKVCAELITLGHTVICTRKSDVTLSLEDRVTIQKNDGCDLFVSIHHDAFDDPNANGYTVFFYPGSGSGGEVAQLVSKEIETIPTHLQNRGIRDANYYVLKKTDCTAILVECGFMTNVNDLEWLMTESNKDLLAEKIAAGINRFTP
jgi:N-acetylmuramoyl-L-alanine amidase